MEGIQLSVEQTGAKSSISVIKVGGYIDTTTSSELEHALNTLLKQGAFNIIIDLGNVDYVSSAGWGIFISEIKGIREKGGDLKLVRMIPEVYEVFELLEFHYILKAFDTIEDAIRDFERNMPNKIVSNVVEMSPERRRHTSKQNEEIKSEAKRDSRQGEALEDKIRKIIAENPDAGTTQIVRTLSTQEYGYIKLGWFALRKILKRIDLDSKKKRFQYAATHKS